MSKYEIIPTIMRRDNLSLTEAAQLFREAREAIIEDGEDPEEVCYDFFGLEPDYVPDLLC